MENSIFRVFSGSDILKKDWILFENDLLNHGFIKEYLGKELKYVFEKTIDNIKFNIIVKPLYFNLLEIDISFIVNIKISLVNGSILKRPLVDDSNIYYIDDQSFVELCKNFPILKL